MIRIQRLGILVLGVWLGAGIFADFAVIQNFRAVDRFLTKPGNAAIGLDLNNVERERDLLRRNAAEENAVIFRGWERAEFAIAAVLIALLAIDGAPALNVAIAFFMLAIVAVQHFALSPQIAALGRLVPTLPPNNPALSRFWVLHGAYSGSEILKLVTGFALALRLVLSSLTCTTPARVAGCALRLPRLSSARRAALRERSTPPHAESPVSRGG